MKQLCAILVAFLLLVAACKKDKNAEPELPPYTQEGKNIIACRMEGKVYISQGTTFLSGHNSIYRVIDTFKRLWITGQTDSPRFIIHLECPFKVGEASITAGTYPYRSQISDYSNNTTIPLGGNSFQTDSLHTGTVTVTYYDSTIIAGYFQMDVVNDAGEVKHITDGRFDIGPD